MDIQNSTALQAFDVLAAKNRELRKENVKLIEEKRELLLQLQQFNHAHGNLARGSDSREEFGRKNEVLEMDAGPFHHPTNRQAASSGLTDNRQQGTSWEVYESKDFRCSCESFRKLQETITANQQWNDSYMRLVQRYHDSEKKIRELENDLECKNEENNILNELLKKLESDLEKSVANNSRSDTRSQFNSDDVEALKIQLQAYQEDFSCEKKEKLKSEKNAASLKKMLADANSTVESLSQELSQYKSYLLRMSEEKKHVLLELRKLSDSGYFAPPPQFRAPVRRNGSLPLNTINDVTSWPSSPPAQFRRSDSDIYRNADVVRDSA